MGIDPINAVKMFMQGDPNIQTPAQALEMLYRSGRIDQAAYETFKGMV